MMVFKRKEVIAAALVVLIGVAGYLNWSYQDEIRVTDGELYAETGKRLGEAQYVSSSKTDVEDKKEESADNKDANDAKDSTDSKDAKEDKKESKKKDAEKQTSAVDSFATAKLEKENSRSKALEILNQTAANESFDDDTRKQAQDRILKMASNVEKESTIENIAKAKGYSEIAVYIDGTAVDMLVKKADLSEEDIAKLKDIAAEQLNIGAKDIKIVQVK